MIIITVARKPPPTSTTACVLDNGCGGININGTRIGFASEQDKWKPAQSTKNIYGAYMDGSGQEYKTQKQDGSEYEPTKLDAKPNDKGRFPANLLLAHKEGCKHIGKKKVKGSHTKKGQIINAKTRGGYDGGFDVREVTTEFHYSDEDGLETVEHWVCVEECPVAILDTQSLDGGMHSAGHAKAHDTTRSNSGVTSFGGGDAITNGGRYGDNGGASRFFKVFGDKK